MTATARIASVYIPYVIKTVWCERLFFMNRTRFWLIGFGMIGIGIVVAVVWIRQQGERLPFTVIYEDMGWNLDSTGDSCPFPNRDFLVLYHPYEAEPYFPNYLLPLIQQQDFNKNVVIYVQGDTPILAPIEIVQVRLLNENQVIIEVKAVPLPREPGSPDLPMLGLSCQVIALDKSNLIGRNLLFIMKREGQSVATFYRQWEDLYSPILITPTPTLSFTLPYSSTIPNRALPAKW
jgi:hypothetical protein